MSDQSNSGSDLQSEAALEGWFTMDSQSPALLGSQCTECGSYYFPKISNFCKNPLCESSEFLDVPLSRTGKIWSFTSAEYQPPEPYVVDGEFAPFCIAAVELEKEKMIVLGQMVVGTEIGQLHAGMRVELMIERLFTDEHSEKVVWKWQPINATSQTEEEA